MSDRASERAIERLGVRQSVKVIVNEREAKPSQRRVGMSVCMFVCLCLCLYGYLFSSNYTEDTNMKR